MSCVAWLLVGLLAGWLAGLVMKVGGYGVIGDIIVGIFAYRAGFSIVQVQEHIWELKA